MSERLREDIERTLTAYRRKGLQLSDAVDKIELLITRHEPEHEKEGDEFKVKVFNTHCQHCSEPVSGSPVILCRKCGEHPGYQHMGMRVYL